MQLYFIHVSRGTLSAWQRWWVLSSTGGSSNEPSAATTRLEPRHDHQDRIWRLGDRWRRLGIRLGTPRRPRFAGDHASRTGARSELDRYGRSVRARSFRGSGRPPAVRTAAIRSPNGLHQVWIDLGSQQSDSRAATSAQAGFYSAGERRFVAAGGRGKALPPPNLFGRGKRHAPRRVLGG